MGSSLDNFTHHAKSSTVHRHKTGINSWQTDTLPLNRRVPETNHTDMSCLSTWAEEVSFQKPGRPWPQHGLGHTVPTQVKKPHSLFSLSIYVSLAHAFLITFKSYANNLNLKSIASSDLTECSLQDGNSYSSFYCLLYRISQKTPLKSRLYMT